MTSAEPSQSSFHFHSGTEVRASIVQSTSGGSRSVAMTRNRLSREPA